MEPQNESVLSPNMAATGGDNNEQTTLGVTEGVYMTLASILALALVNRAIKMAGPPPNLRESEWRWRNLTVSFINSTVSGLWVLASYSLHPVLLSNPIDHDTDLTYLCTCYLGGYFIYDTLDMVLNLRPSEFWELGLHHILTAGVYLYHVVYKFQIGFAIVASTVEVHTVWLHARKRLKMVGTPYHTRRFLVVKYLNLLCYVPFRMLPGLLMTLAVWVHRDRCSWFYFVFTLTATSFVDVLNAVLLYRLVKSDQLRSSITGKRIGLLESLRTDWTLLVNGGPSLGAEKKKDGDGDVSNSEAHNGSRDIVNGLSKNEDRHENGTDLKQRLR